ncbi:hypothetical protein PILCRDRAFT_12029 [Piloderma croceum F 1598]|uniref:PIH1 N-terminal domain-containing protein n=1 Tax=Piloderma croceum (strain F 1598) TaxID=765440 RepID=A0A0C3BJ34_PILCF|nr:hypothetical protein PILCRDRAFT_12029 [Piloderma croceum F 1598]
MSFVSVKLKPSPGFVVKSTTLNDAQYRSHSQALSTPSSTLLEPSSDIGILVPKGLKVFVNIAWDANVPPPPEGSEDVIQKAMLGEDLDDLNPEGWYVPAIVSGGRQDKDKAGKLSLVFDAVFNSSLKTRTLTDPEFKTFLIELAFQRIEAQKSGSILLSRQIGTPNIASKGKLEPRTVQIPRVLYPEGHPSRGAMGGGVDAGVDLGASGGGKGKGKKLIEEIGEGEKNKGKGILKTPAKSVSSTVEVPSWTWSKTSNKIKIIINVPKLTHPQIPSSTLDLEPRRIILSTPALYELDVNLDASDAEIAATFSKEGGAGEDGMESALTLKRMRDLDVQEARAEWRVGEGVVVVYA